MRKKTVSIQVPGAFIGAAIRYSLEKSSVADRWSFSRVVWLCVTGVLRYNEHTGKIEEK